MDRGLVVVERTDEHRELLREAAEIAAGTGAELVLFSVLTEDEYEEDARVIDSLGSIEDLSYDSDAVIDAAESGIEEFARDVIPDGVDYRIAVRAAEDGSRADAVLDAAEEYECDHVFLLGRQRSPTGKALFGDVAQQVALNFDGPVTLSTN